MHRGFDKRVAINERLFPRLVQTGYRLTSPPDAVYNCIAWAAGVTDAWWWPDPDRFDYWSPGILREPTLSAFEQVFVNLGYRPCEATALEPGWDKVAIYATAAGPTHAARQLPTGRWTSKLGPDEDIEHDLDGLVGSAYGTVALLLRRPAVDS